MARLNFAVAVLSILAFFFGSDALAVDGWASENGGTTGGAGGTTVIVGNPADFKTYVESNDVNDVYIVRVAGTIDLNSVGDMVYIASDKTIEGINTDSTIIGQLGFQDGASNVIIRYLNVTNPHVGLDEGDGISVKRGVTNVFITKCNLYDTSDGTLDITHASDYVTVSWCKFYYPYDTGHCFASLVGHNDSDFNDVNHLNVTFHHNWWYSWAKERMPRVRFGQAHVYNNYYNGRSDTGYCIGVGDWAHIRVEGNYFNAVKLPWKQYWDTSNPGEIGWDSNNVFYNVSVPTWSDNNYATIFTPPYDYTLDDANDIPDIVMAGAGNVAEANGLTAPTGLEGSATGDGTISLDWNDNSGGDVNGYNIYRSTISGSGYVKLNDTLLATSDYIDDTATGGITSYYIVTAVDANDTESDYSDEEAVVLGDWSTQTFVFSYAGAKLNYSYDSTDGNWADWKGTQRGYFIIDVNSGGTVQLDSDKRTMSFQLVYDSNCDAITEQINAGGTWLLSRCNTDYSLNVEGNTRIMTIAGRSVSVPRSLKGKSVNNLGSDPRYIELGPVTLKLDTNWTTQSLQNYWTHTQTKNAIQSNLEQNAYTELTDLTTLESDSNYYDLLTPDVNTLVYSGSSTDEGYSASGGLWQKSKTVTRYFLVVSMEAGDYTQIAYDLRAKTYQVTESGTYQVLIVNGTTGTLWLFVEADEDSTFAVAGAAKSKRLGTVYQSVAATPNGYLIYDQGDDPRYVGRETIKLRLNNSLSTQCLENDWTVEQAVDAVKAYLDGKGCTEVP